MANCLLVLLLILVACSAWASTCMSKPELESYALAKLQPLFSARAARLTKVVLSDGSPSICITADAKPNISMADHGVLFAKMWLNMTLADGKTTRYQAGLTFDKRVWRVKHAHSANAVLSLNDVVPDWQQSTRLTLNDTLFDSRESHYKVLKNIRKNQVISSSEVAPVMLIEAGQQVLAKYHSGSIMLEVKARALSSGNLDDTITVLLSNQNEPVKGIIQNSMDVYVQQ